MASFTRSFFFFFITIILSTLLLSTQIHARESYFFHKLQRDNAQVKNPSFVPVEANQKTSVEALPKKQQEQQDQDPRFVPESENGYGLYGHETTYNSENNNNNENTNNYNENTNNYNSNNNEEFDKQYEENVNYEPYNTPSLSQTEESYNYDKYSKDNENYNKDNNNNDKNYYNSNAYGRERSSSYNGYNNNKNMERQGMSDTRFMENGKYYFDINDDNNHGDLYKKHYRHNPSYAVSNYDRFGQNDNGGSFYNNNEQTSFKDPYNSKWEKNMMNEQEQEEEFGEEQQDQFVP